MEKRISREAVLRKLAQLAFGKANDAVRLALADPEYGLPEADGLDLTALAEIKRGAGGSVEIKLVDRLAAARLLLETLQESGEADADRFLAALCRSGSGRGEGSDMR